MEEYKYIDIDSTFRNRNNYPNPYDFVIPYKFSNKGSTTLSYLDPILESTPYTGSTLKLPGQLVTGVSIDQSTITLDSDDVDIDNFYINRTLQIGTGFRNIVSYNGLTKVATVDSDYNTLPAPGTQYYIRTTRSYYNSNVSIILDEDSTTTFSKFNLLTLDPAALNNFFEGSFIRYTNGPSLNKTSVITNYLPSGNIPTWRQENNLGSSSYISTVSENGFQFSPATSGQLSDITIRVISFESNDPYRTFRLKILNGAGLDSSILHQEDFTISNTLSPNDIIFPITAGPNLYISSFYTLSLIDITTGGESTGFINLFGIEQSSNYVTYNCNTYPKMDINIFPASSIPIWSENVSLGKDGYISTLSEQGFLFSLNESGTLNRVIINLLAFESISIGRTITLKIRSGSGVTGTVIYQQNYTINNQAIASDYIFSISGIVNITANDLYTITMIDITSGGSISGYVNVYGIESNTSYISFNTNRYPKLSIVYSPPESNIWTQSSGVHYDSIISTSAEQGYTFLSSGNGVLSGIRLYLNSYENVASGRTLRLRIRFGGGISGTIIYETTFNIANIISPENYLLTITSGPTLNSLDPYTFTLQDITPTGNSTGFINIYGILPDPTFRSYNNTIYPYTEISATLGSTTAVWEQIITSVSNNITSETGFGFIPSDSGTLTNINLKFKTNSTTTLFTLIIREGSGISGTILFQSDYTYNLAAFTLTDIPIIDGPFLTSGQNYTLTLQSETLTFLIAGDTSSITYPVYGSGAYPNLSLIAINGFTAWSQLSNPTLVELISSSEKAFKFIPEGSGSYLLTSIDLKLFNFNLGSSRNLTINVREGSGIGGAIVFTTTYSIPQHLSGTIVNIPINNPIIISGSPYTISISDPSSGTGGYMYFYGITSNGTYSAYNTSIYPTLNVYGNISTLGFSQTTNQTITTILSTSAEQGFSFIPPISGKFSRTTLQLSSFESDLSGRTVSLKIRSGPGTSGTILFSNTFVVTNNQPRFEYSFNTGNILDLTSGTIYTLTLLDVTSGENSTGNIYLYGIVSNITYASSNTSIYPKLSIFSAVSTSVSTQPSDVTYTAIISNSTEQMFSIVPTIPGTLNSILISLSSFSSLGGRTLQMSLYEGNDNTTTPLVQDNVIIPNINTRTDVDLAISLPIILQQNFRYTLSFLDITGGSNNGATWIYGIIPTIKFSTNSTVYPRIRLIIPSFTITVSPPQDISNFLNNNLDNIEFNTKANENTSTMLINSNPDKNVHLCEIELLNLTLPFRIISSGYGGYITDYPYVYLHLYNESGDKSINILTSNNPNSTKALFKVSTRPETSPGNFIVLKGCDKQTASFRPDMDIRLTVTLPNGTIILNDISDRFTPLFPDPFLQISIALAIRYIKADESVDKIDDKIEEINEVVEEIDEEID